MVNTRAGSDYWVIVADEARAIVYTRAKKYSPLSETYRLDNPDARARTSELITDRGGRSFDSHGQGRHTMTGESDPKTQVATVFAKELARRIGRALNERRCSEYAIVAAPRFLGLLRSALEAANVAPPYLSIGKLMVGRDASDIEKMLVAHSP